MYLTDLPFCVTTPRGTGYGPIRYVNIDFCETETAVEGIFSDFSDTFADGDGTNVITIFEGPVSDGSDGVRDSNGSGEAGTLAESSVSDGRNAFSKGDTF